jgi:hypothetical protein
MTRFPPLVTAFALALSAAAFAQSPIHPAIWNAIGNTGVVDEADTSIYVFNSTGSVAIKGTLSSATLDIRYNVTGLPHVFSGEPDPEEPAGRCVLLRAMLRDTGPGARVIVKLQQLDLFRGTGLRTLAVVDSDVPLPDHGSTDYRRLEHCAGVPQDFQFEYGQFVYFIEAQLIKRTLAANPGLMAVSVCARTTMCVDN